MNKCRSDVIKEKYTRIKENSDLFSTAENEKANWTTIPHIINLNH